MKELIFLKRNKEKWESFEKAINNTDQKTPDELANLYIELTDDLSFARTFYKESKTSKYLNSIAGKAHHLIYKNKAEYWSRIKNFWVNEVPFEVIKGRRQLLFALVLTFLSVLIGLVSAINDDTFVRLAMGDYYVNMTEYNISQGDPMAVYKSSSRGPMALGITINNIMVSFYVFICGITFGILTVLGIFNNTVDLGPFHYMFYQHGYLSESLQAVYLHGTFEISAIIIAAGAGLVMARGLLFPKTFKRSVSFVNAAKSGLKIIIGLVPFFIVAGFIEGFVTRNYQRSPIVNYSIIFTSLAIIIGYFVVYPMILSKRRKKVNHGII